jgi:hypothetical protein
MQPRRTSFGGSVVDGACREGLVRRVVALLWMRELCGNRSQTTIAGMRATPSRRPARISGMITGTHLLFYSEQAEADRDFFRDVLGFDSIDAGHGWLIFALPPAEAGIHPTGTGQEHAAERQSGSLLSAEIYLMCDDLQAEIMRLQSKKVPCSAVEEAPWGKKITFRLPSGGRLGLYQPAHPTAIGLKSK